MTDKKCLICRKEIDKTTCSALQITFNIPRKHLFMTLNIYCEKCNENIVLPTIRDISDKLKLDYRG